MGIRIFAVYNLHRNRELTNNKQISSILQRSNLLMIFWCFVASFGAYFCMYAFRKPFSSAEYAGFELMGMSLKTVLILSQVFGYMLSKFIGVKVISELKASKRVRLIIGLILFAELALALFGLVPNGVKPIMLFLNGIPLGMVWGVVFSFLEGRRVTELIATGLSVSAIVSSGMLKSFGRILIEDYGVSDFWMPALIGGLFIPLFLFFVWMLSRIPAPDKRDENLKSKREAMKGEDRLEILKTYGLGILMLVLTYALFSIFRDFRDNFSIEIWSEMQAGNVSAGVYTRSELPIAVIVIITTAFLVLFKSNYRGFLFTCSFVFLGLLIIGLSTVLFEMGSISPLNWMIVNGLGLYMAYVPFQIVMYERLVALFRMKGNAGYLMYISDSIGYLGSVGVMTYKEFFQSSISWLNFFQSICYWVAIIGGVCLFVALFFFVRKQHRVKQLKVIAA